MPHTELVSVGAGAYVEWGWFSVGVTNLVIIGIMLAVFALALVVPFGHPAELPHGAGRLPQPACASGADAQADQDADLGRLP